MQNKAPQQRRGSASLRSASRRAPLIAANWKMHKTVAETEDFLERFIGSIGGLEAVDIVICPPYTALAAATERTRRSPVQIAAQNLHEQDEGAFTGEVSAPMLRELGVYAAIVGHSERRQHFGETDEMVRKKVRAVFAADMVPILCVGETLEERDSGRTEDKVVGQVKTALTGLEEKQVASLVVAYEPIWAIGTGRNANPTDAGEVIGLIRRTASNASSEPASGSMRVQYGGSVKAGNIREFMAHPEIDGALVGGASLDPEEFALIVKYR
jgi:triosephosphate isomerase (TIM)